MSADEARGTGTEIVQEKPSSSSTQASPSKVPASLASKTKDELAELLVSTLRQLKARDQKLKELNEVRATTDAGRQERHDAELAALKDRILVVEKEYAELVRRREEETKQREEETKQREEETKQREEETKQREEETKQREASAEELSGLRKSQAKLKKAVVELRKRNESLDKRHGEIDAARCAAVDELRKAEAQIAAFAEYKQKAHALLKAKDEEIKNGSMEIREGLEAELNAEKAARKKAELARDAAAEELGKVQSQAAAQIHEVEMQHKDRLVCH
jgi:chromosome segregation ATPase